MSIDWDSRNKRWRFAFKRSIQGRRYRLSRLLPSGWSQTQADAYDRTESARLYALASGVQRADPLIDEAVAHYLRDKTALKSYKATAENLAAIAWAYTGRPMSALPAISREVAANTAGARKGTTVSPATIRNRLACLKAACRWGWKAHGLVEHDPTTRMQMPQVRNERHVYVQRAGMLKLARAADRPDLRVAIRVAFYTGMRLGELQRVKVKGRTLHLADTKNGDRRSIPAHPRIASCLSYLPLTAPKITLQRAWQRARAAVGMDDVHFHDLRHSAASEMVNGGVDLYTVGKVLGHRDARSTQRYAHLTADTLAAAVSAIGKRQIRPHKPPTAGKKKAA
ncbi:MAG: site-specific integrase [Pseudomonadota bacterium]